MADYAMARNGSGYFDETAYHAFREMAKSGEIWTYDGRGKEMLVLKNLGWFCSGLALTERQYGPECMPVTSRARMYTNPGMVQWVKAERLGQYIRTCPQNEFNGIVRAVGEALAIPLIAEESAPSGPQNGEADKPSLAAYLDAYFAQQKQLLLRLAEGMGHGR